MSININPLWSRLGIEDEVDLIQQLFDAYYGEESNIGTVVFVNSQVAELKKPSSQLTDRDVDRIIEVLGMLDKLYESLNFHQKRQFLRHFIQKIWVKDKKIADIEHPEAFKILLERDLVRIRDMWLANQDSNL